MKIAIAADHGGFELKEELVSYLTEEGYQVEDLGTHAKASVDYPAYGEKAARLVVDGKVDKGIVVCGTGIGIGISANKVKGIRCALCHDVFSAKASRAHNDANMLSLGGRVIGSGLAKEIVSAWLGGSFEGGRHQRRVDEIRKIEDQSL